MLECFLCHTKTTDIDSAVDAGWIPYVWNPPTNMELGPICERCAVERTVAAEADIEIDPPLTRHRIEPAQAAYVSGLDFRNDLQFELWLVAAPDGSLELYSAGQPFGPLWSNRKGDVD